MRNTCPLYLLWVVWRSKRYWHLWKDSKCTESKSKSTHVPVHKGYSWYACSTLSPAGLDINSRIPTATQSLANGYIAALKPQASLLLVPKTANLELIISLCAIATLWLKEVIHQKMLDSCHMNLQWTIQNATRCSTRHLLLLSNVN